MGRDLPTAVGYIQLMLMVDRIRYLLEKSNQFARKTETRQIQGAIPTSSLPRAWGTWRQPRHSGRYQRITPT